MEKQKGKTEFALRAKAAAVLCKRAATSPVRRFTESHVLWELIRVLLKYVCALNKISGDINKSLSQFILLQQESTASTQLQSVLLGDPDTRAQLLCPSQLCDSSVLLTGTDHIRCFLRICPHKNPEIASELTFFCSSLFLNGPL